MVNLKYIENPFTDDYLYSFECFRNEKLFYNCVDRRIVSSNNSFENLGSSFYTYLITGDSGEWIGYVLFHNVDFINGYINNIKLELEKLLLKLKQSITDNKVLKDIDLLLDDLYHNKYSDTTSLSLLEEKIQLLKSSCTNEKNQIYDYFREYEANNFMYLYNFDNYYYLDIIIGLNLDTKKEDIELKYYGFIREVYQRVEELILDKFIDIPIVLKSSDSTLCLINHEQLKIKSLVKRGNTIN